MSTQNEKELPIHFSLTLPHLQITLSPDEYRALPQKYKVVPVDAGENYWLRLPSYIIAHCPFCGSNYDARLDTHSIRWLAQNPTTKPTDIGSTKYQNVGCMHFVAVTSFIHLHGHLPTEQSLFICRMGDVPTLTPTFLPDDLPAIAVMHSLPICRIEQNAFVPRYSLYIITYYATDPDTLWQRRRAEMQKIADDLAGGDEDWAMHIAYVATSCLGLRQPETQDLAQWVARGKLQWLDLHSPELPLRQGPVADFPYAHIQGVGRPYTYTQHSTWPWDKWRYPNGRIQLGACI